MEDKNAAKQLINKAFQCSVICEIGHGGSSKNKDEKYI
jgi:hypothetical protein